MTDRPIDLDETRGCPIAGRCLACGTVDTPANDLGVQTATTPLGVICLTLCAWCADDGELPRFGMVECVEWSMAHCDHLGITTDEMAAAMTSTKCTIRHYG
jgi:hypothetical protein